MARLNIDRQKELEPKRMEYAKSKISALGYEVKESDKMLQFIHDGSVITFYPYSGWHTGKTIKDGRGINNLLRQIQCS
jgi:hypothetical protein